LSHSVAPVRRSSETLWAIFLKIHAQVGEIIGTVETELLGETAVNHPAVVDELGVGVTPG
jgi:hypothetical protein